MKRILLTLMGLFLTSILWVSCSKSDSDKVIPFSDLPPTAQTFLGTHFPSVKASKIEKDSDADSNGAIYEVELANGTEIDFDAQGNWVSIDGGKNALPDTILAENANFNNALRYIRNALPDAKITEIKRTKNGFEIELDNFFELEFSPEGKFIKQKD